MSAVRRQIELLKAAKARRENIAMRLIATLAIALILHVYVQMAWVWLWAAIYLAALGLERWLLGDVVRNPDTPPAAWRRWIILVMPAVTSATFGFLSLPLFASTLWALKGLAPTRLALAGASAGLLSGALGALVYSLHCPESAAPFLAVWYVLGIAIPTLAGALLGPRVLRW